MLKLTVNLIGTLIIAFVLVALGVNETVAACIAGIEFLGVMHASK